MLTPLFATGLEQHPENAGLGVAGWRRAEAERLTARKGHTFQRALPCSRTRRNHVCKQLWSV